MAALALTVSQLNLLQLNNTCLGEEVVRTNVRTLAHSSDILSCYLLIRLKKTQRLFGGKYLQRSSKNPACSSFGSAPAVIVSKA